MVMEALALDPDGYSGTYKLIGGRLALDFANTISWPDTDRAHDWLGTINNLKDWCQAVDLSLPTATGNDLAAVQDLRGGIAGVLRPIAHSQNVSPEAFEIFNDRLHAAHLAHRIDPDTLSLEVTHLRTMVDALAPVVLDAADIVLNTNRHHRLRYCPACDWLFEDQTRNGRRRWCDMADCGSRAKSRSYYQRTTKGLDSH